MNNIKFVKSFSKGQITIPKPIREHLGMGEDFWLKLYVEGGKIVGEPLEQHGQKKISREEYIQKLLSLKGGWLNPKELARNRKGTEVRIKRAQKQLESAFSVRGKI